MKVLFIILFIIILIIISCNFPIIGIILFLVLPYFIYTDSKVSNKGYSKDKVEIQISKMETKSISDIELNDKNITINKEFEDKIEIELTQKDKLISQLKADDIELREKYANVKAHFDDLNNKNIALKKELDKLKSESLANAELYKKELGYLKEKNEEIQEHLLAYRDFEKKYNDMRDELLNAREKYKDSIIIEDNKIVADINQYRILSLRQYNEICNIRKNIKVLHELLSVLINEFSKLYDVKSTFFHTNGDKAQLEYLVKHYDTELLNYKLQINDLTCEIEILKKEKQLSNWDDLSLIKEIDLLLVAGCKSLITDDPYIELEKNNWKYYVSTVSDRFRGYGNKTRSFNIKIKKLEEIIEQLSSDIALQVKNDILDNDFSSYGLKEKDEIPIKTITFDDRYNVKHIRFYVAGLNYIEDYMSHSVAEKLKKGDELVLSPEPDNIKDYNAVCVYVPHFNELCKIGYVEKQFAKEIKDAIETDRFIKSMVDYTLGSYDYIKVYGYAFILEK